MGSMEELTGKRFGRMTVIRQTDRPPGKLHNRYWLCRCDCGNEKVYCTGEINRGAIVSCGCYHREMASKRAYEQHLTHGKTGTRLYGIWNAMKDRCSNPNCKTFHLYGGRGIKVCEEWKHSFEAFSEWAVLNGYDPSKKRGECTVDRIDVNGNYCPENCRIVSQKEQCKNKRSNRMITYNGETKTMTEWAEQYGLRVGTLRDRLSYGWDVERCLTQPLRHW